MLTYGQGLLFGVAYIAPIGVQNLYTINTALAQPRGRALRAALIITFFDISLALASFFGIGKLLEVIPLLEQVILIVCSLMVLAIGVSLLKAQDVTSLTQRPTSVLATGRWWRRPSPSRGLIHRRF